MEEHLTSVFQRGLSTVCEKQGDKTCVRWWRGKQQVFVKGGRWA